MQPINRFIMRTWMVYVFLATIVIIPFLIWGDWFMGMFSEEGAVSRIEAFGNWAWLAGLLLLIADLFLPLPGTIIMSALGYLYGPIWGGLLAVLGGFLSGILAYGLCRMMGKKAALWILGEKGLEKGEQVYNKNGGWIVAISRWLPVLPEVIACMAGLNQMKSRPFIIGLLCGSIPLGFTFAYIGYAGLEHPYWAMVISAGLPPVLWLMARYFLKNLIGT
ncbi:MAG: VTT domain-containing protein [Saprospiraceae bacterium]